MATKWKPIAFVLATASIVLSLQLAIFGLADKALAAEDSVDANPTLTIVALAIRQADHIAERMHARTL